jgi:hypothetical protein
VDSDRQIRGIDTTSSGDTGGPTPFIPLLPPPLRPRPQNASDHYGLLAGPNRRLHIGNPVR